MTRNSYINPSDSKAGTATTTDQLRIIEGLISTSTVGLPIEKPSGRNLLTRTLDRLFAAVRYYLPPLHWLGINIFAFTIFIYVRLVALTIRLVTTGRFRWPNIPAPCVLALWHGDAPSFLCAFAACRPASEVAIMISPDPRGDYLNLLCRKLGLTVVRGSSAEGGWEALIELAHWIEQGASVVMTVDGGGPAHVVKVGAVAVASATHVPVVPLSADCNPAIAERHKWDAANNPVPFAEVTIAIGEPLTIEELSEIEMIEHSSQSLQRALEQL